MSEDKKIQDILDKHGVSLSDLLAALREHEQASDTPTDRERMQIKQIACDSGVDPQIALNTLRSSGIDALYRLVRQARRQARRPTVPDMKPTAADATAAEFEQLRRRTGQQLRGRIRRG